MIYYHFIKEEHVHQSHAHIHTSLSVSHTHAHILIVITVSPSIITSSYLKWFITYTIVVTLTFDSSTSRLLMYQLVLNGNFAHSGEK